MKRKTTVRRRRPIRRIRRYRKRIMTSGRINRPYDVINKNRKIYRFTRSLVAQTTCNSFTAANTVTAATAFFTQPANALNDNIVSQMMGFKLSDLPNYTEFTSLFAKYRIKKIELLVKYSQSANISNEQPTMYIWKNHKINNTVALTNAAAVDESRYVTRYQFDNMKRACRFAIHPFIATDVMISGGTASFSSEKYNEWIDTSNPSALYYSVCILWSQLCGSTITPVEYTFDATYHLEFTNNI